MDRKYNFTDTELLELLEKNNFKASYKNLLILKEGLENGTILLEEPEVEEEVEEEKVVEEEAPREEEAPTMPETDSVLVDTEKPVVITKDNTVVTIAEKLNSFKTDRLLKSFLIEDCNCTESEYSSLREEVKVESVKEIAANILRSVEEKLLSIDTSSADRSRGDIKQLKELRPIQDVITSLETMIERDAERHPEYSEAVNVIIKSILCLNQQSAVFKDAYRNKKTALILKYESVILSIISSVSYLLSTIVDYKGGTAKLKPNATLLADFAPLQSLRTFVNSVNSGEFKTVVKDTNMLREYHLEVSVETMGMVLEATDYVPMIVDGIKNIYNTLIGDNSSKLTNLLYKAAGYIVLIFSLRDAFYTLFRMKTKVSDMVGQIENFAALNDGGNVINKLMSFANKYKSDAEFSSDLCKTEIADENKKLLGQVRAIQGNAAIPAAKMTDTVTAPQKETLGQNDIAGMDSFGFDF